MRFSLPFLRVVSRSFLVLDRYYRQFPQSLSLLVPETFSWEGLLVCRTVVHYSSIRNWDENLATGTGFPESVLPELPHVSRRVPTAGAEHVPRDAGITTSRVAVPVGPTIGFCRLPAWQTTNNDGLPHGDNTPRA